MLPSNPARVWDTFAEPNNINNTECSFCAKSGFNPSIDGPRPKSRLTEEGCGQRQLKTCLLGVQKHLTKPSGLFYALLKSIQHPEFDRLIDLAQFFDNLLVILLVNICYYITDSFISF
jgi:hypothetical protein